MAQDPKILTAALIWLLNHYEQREAESKQLRGRVIHRIEAVLKDADDVSIADMMAFRQAAQGKKEDEDEA